MVLWVDGLFMSGLLQCILVRLASLSSKKKDLVALYFIGQGLKDIIRWPRPGRPAYQLQSKWLLEYGMPSTHAMIGVCIPFSVVLFMIDR